MTYPAYSLRTVAITQHQWTALTSTKMENNAVEDVEAARAENLKTLHRLLSKQPSFELRGTNWVEPYHDMKVTIHDTLIKHDTVTGDKLDTHDLVKYDIPYYAMNPERN